VVVEALDVDGIVRRRQSQSSLFTKGGHAWVTHVSSQVKTLVLIFVGADHGDTFWWRVPQWRHCSWEWHYTVLVYNAPEETPIDGDAVCVIVLIIGIV
jgi:hypothetical protein